MSRFLLRKVGNLYTSVTKDVLAYSIKKCDKKFKTMAKKGNKKKKTSWIGILLFFLIGSIIMFYPAISDYWNDLQSKQAIKSYQNAMAQKDAVTLEDIYQRAVAYNYNSLHNFPSDAFNGGAEKDQEYDSQLNINGDGVMGYVEVPKIKQRLVIYHGTSEEVLQKGCGHLKGTSLPVGGKGTHAVIAGHRGLPQMKLFTDLDLIKEGDHFNLYILNKILAYEVDQIKVVTPDKTEDMMIDSEQDYVTLVTCTPYGVNSHRLLVRGHRTEYVPEEEGVKLEGKNILRSWQAKAVMVLAFLLLAFLAGVLTGGKKKKKT